VGYRALWSDEVRIPATSSGAGGDCEGVRRAKAKIIIAQHSHAVGGELISDQFVSAKDTMIAIVVFVIPGRF
jgi:hypothetical protein